MSLRNDVANAIINAGRATADDILPLFPGHGRREVIKALWAASKAGLIDCIKKGRTGRKAEQSLSVYAPALKSERMARLPTPSVFDLGAEQRFAVWPPKFAGGRSYSPLGSWRD